MSTLDKDGMYDLFAIHCEKAARSELSIHPARWLARGTWPSLVFDFIDRQDERIVVGNVCVNNHREIGKLGLRRKIRRQYTYYYATDLVAKRYREFKPEQENFVECAVRDLLWLKNPEAKPDAYTPVGTIDLLTEKELIEVKNIRHWKHGLGQVLAYSTYFNNHARVLHLFGEAVAEKRWVQISEICQSFRIEARFQNVPKSRVAYNC